MFKKIFLLYFILVGLQIQSQELSSSFKIKTFEIKKDTIQIDSLPINSQEFKIFDSSKNLIESKNYKVDFSEAILIINSKKYPKIIIEYFLFPEFVTKTYSPFGNKVIIQNKTNNGTLYSLTSNINKSKKKPFDGLETRGFIVRGFTSGNNQNGVTNSSLDLEISGKLSDKVNLRANIFDTNIPIQQNGVSQNLTDFDRIFVELTHEKWRVKAGDLSIKNNETFFFPFQKQVSGLEVEAKVSDELNIQASGAVVRGKFNTYRFTGIEGNQGPYKIFGANNEASILMIEGAEQVYVNGNLIKRGENEDYTINYNLAEITFNTTFPITNDMRIWIDFQYAERNYTRFITYEKAEYKGEKLNISGYFYSENDAKNQPIQQNLTEEQKEILANAGNNVDEMFANSAYPDSFDENKILYKKVTSNQIEYFEYSTNPNDELFNVTFTNVGSNNGDYILENTIAIGNIFSYVGPNLGNYSAVVRLVAPTKSQLFLVKSEYNSSKKTEFNSEIAISNHDKNLFSSLDDDQNTALAARIEWQQVIIDKKWKLKSKINHEYANENFYSEQVWEPVEFNRDWNIVTNNATKNYFQSELTLENNEDNFLNYKFSNLNYNNGYRGNRHLLKSKFNKGKITLYANMSVQKNTSSLEDNSFFRSYGKINYNLKKSWFGGIVNFETNSKKDVVSKQFLNTSHKYQDYEIYYGIGDSTKVFAKVGYNFRNNDSIRLNKFTEINNRNTIYLNSKLIQNKNTNLSLFANYRFTKNSFTNNEKTLNSRLVYNQNLLKKILNISTTYETSSGNVARQDFVYVKVEQGLGFYTWIDYNNDGIEDFDEFEIAQFPDQANYLRLPSPNLTFIPTQRAKLQQVININFGRLSNENNPKNIISKFYNQTYFTIDNERERIGDTFHFNPFDIDENSLISLNYNIRNSFYFKRGLQRNSMSYTYGNTRLKQQFFIGNQENKINVHQLDYIHKFLKFWRINITSKISNNILETENFLDRNYEIEAFEINPKFSFLYNQNNRFSLYYHLKNKENKIVNFESLQQQNFGLEYFYLSKKQNQISANINYFLNDFTGETNSPVAYQMLEGLQAGKNYTWNVIFNQKLNSFLNLNLSYLGRKSENSKSIHTGSIQLRANF